MSAPKAKGPLVLGLVMIATITVVALCAIRRIPVSKEADSGFPTLEAPAASCPVAVEHALAQVQREREEATARGARYGFDPREGEIARSLLAEAAACATTVSEFALAEHLTVRAEQWTSRLDADYRAHRVALAVAVERKDWAAVKRDAAWLRRLLTDREGGYVTRLSELEHRARKGEP